MRQFKDGSWSDTPDILGLVVIVVIVVLSESGFEVEGVELHLADLYLCSANFCGTLLVGEGFPLGGRGGDEVHGVVGANDEIFDETASVLTEGAGLGLTRDVLKTRAV